MTKSAQTPARTEGPSPKQTIIAAFAIAAIVLHLVLHYGTGLSTPILGLPLYQLPLVAALLFGGIPLIIDLLAKVLQGEFGTDMLAGISIVTSAILGTLGGGSGSEYLAGALVVLMLSGGTALEAYAVRSASSVLEALARRMPTVAHAKREAAVVDIPIEQVKVGDILAVYPHETCPVDGVVLEGHGRMDESYLTGEPFIIAKTPGSQVLSGALNSETALTIRAGKLAVDSRYASIMKVMREAQLHRPSIRRLGDQLGAYYTPLAVAVAVVAWLTSGNADRFLAVLVVATPCPLLIAIPV